MNNRAELVAKIAQWAPWLIDGVPAYFPVSIDRKLESLMNDIENESLTIVCDNGMVIKDITAVTVVNKHLKMEMPLVTTALPDTFHVFFKNRSGKLLFFDVNDAVFYPTCFSALLPEKIFMFQKRRYPRIVTSGSLSVMFRSSNNILNNAHIQDISIGGMLICENAGGDNYQLNSIVSDIFISPCQQKQKQNGFQVERKVWPLISKGRVVRAYSDNESGLAFYGIAFMHDSSYVQETLVSLIESFSVQ